MVRLLRRWHVWLMYWAAHFATEVDHPGEYIIDHWKIDFFYSHAPSTHYTFEILCNSLHVFMLLHVLFLLISRFLGLCLQSKNMVPSPESDWRTSGTLMCRCLACPPLMCYRKNVSERTDSLLRVLFHIVFVYFSEWSLDHAEWSLDHVEWSVDHVCGTLLCWPSDLSLLQFCRALQKI